MNALLPGTGQKAFPNHVPQESSRLSRSTPRFTSTLEKSRNKLWICHFCVPDSVAQKLIAGSPRRVIRTIICPVEHQCALLRIGNGSFVISVK